MWVTKGGEQRLINDGTFPYWKDLGWSEWEGPGSLTAVAVTQADYDALPSKDPAVLYVIP